MKYLSGKGPLGYWRGGGFSSRTKNLSTKGEKLKGERGRLSIFIATKDTKSPDDLQHHRVFNTKSDFGKFFQQGLSKTQRARGVGCEWEMGDGWENSHLNEKNLKEKHPVRPGGKEN